MVKGVSVKFQSYSETIPRLLEIIKFGSELKKHEKIVLKPSLRKAESKNTEPKFLEAVLKFCLENKNPEAQVFIAEGSDGQNTMDVFEQTGYKELSERYGVGLIDLNNAEVEEVDWEFLKFQKIKYPKILLESFVVSLPVLALDPEVDITGSLANMLGAFPTRYYSGWFGADKKKLKAWPLKYAIHDILRCKMPEFGIIDASEKGVIFAGQPLEIDKQAAKLVGLDWKSVRHLRLVDESLARREDDKIKEAVEN